MWVQHFQCFQVFFSQKEVFEDFNSKTLFFYTCRSKYYWNLYFVYYIDKRLKSWALWQLILKTFLHWLFQKEVSPPSHATVYIAKSYPPWQNIILTTLRNMYTVSSPYSYHTLLYRDYTVCIPASARIHPVRLSIFLVSAAPQ